MRRLATTLRRFWFEEDGSNAIEFAILAMPFILLLLFVIQISIFFVGQAALDTGVLRAAQDLRRMFYATNITSSSFPNASTLKTNVAKNAGGLIVTANTKVEIRPITDLLLGVVPIIDGTSNSYGTSTSVLALRASATVPTFLPGFSSWVVTSSALVRRQGR